MTWYRVSYALDDDVQRTLDRLYGYEGDLTTKVVHRARLNVVALLLQRLLARGQVTMGPALDIGCSAGAFSRLLADVGFSPVVGIDVDASAVADARKTFGEAAAFVVQSVESLEQSPKYNLVLCTEVLEHVRDPVAAVETIRRVLVPGGVAVISLPNAASLPYAVMRFAQARRRKTVDPELRDHLRFPFYRTLRLLKRAGLEPIATDGANLMLDPGRISRLYEKRWFACVNELNSRLARTSPLTYLSQFFFVAARRDDRVDSGAFRRARG
jgi:2-polyprenyl-3-methyl-5-hydroxy-6-metoxy-1,4-benzoquinol methylase